MTDQSSRTLAASAVGAGVLLLWSGFTGKKWSMVIHSLLFGQSPFAAKQTYPISQPNTAAQTGPSGGVAPPSAQTGPPVSGTVDSWISRAFAIDPGIAQDRAGYHIIIKYESEGNPLARNNWDSNAMAGNPSEGLMQTTISTFNEHALPGHTDIFNPVDNIIAGGRYAIGRYGSISNVPGVLSVRAGKGYVPY